MQSKIFITDEMRIYNFRKEKGRSDVFPLPIELLCNRKPNREADEKREAKACARVVVRRSQ